MEGGRGKKPAFQFFVFGKRKSFQGRVGTDIATEKRDHPFLASL